ncbi:MAG: FHA domain-containing protein [Erysipelotrichaceae bacterium]|nr:FHA domain-containing protein [Erysipelotrichaceae bacterium]
MSEYILLGLIAISLIAALAYFLIRRKNSQTVEERQGQHIFVTNGVDLKTLLYGRRKGDHFDTGQLNDGTVMVNGNATPVCTIVLTNTMTAMEYRKSFNTEVYIGRVKTGDSHEKKIIIEGDPKILATHCRLSYQKHQLLLENLSTKNPTYLNDMRVRGTTIVNQNDELRIGDTRLKIRFRGIH